MTWQLTTNALPEKGRKVDWIAPGGEQVNGGTFAGGAIWFLPGENPMYVYYKPSHWRYSEEKK